MNFPTDEEFEQNKIQRDQIKSWRDVPLDVIYHIENVEEIPSKNGKATVVTLSDKDEKDRIKAFATSCLIKDLRDFGWSYTYFIKSLGLKDSNRNIGQKYYSYDLMIREY